MTVMRHDCTSVLTFILYEKVNVKKNRKINKCSKNIVYTLNVFYTKVKIQYF